LFFYYFCISYIILILIVSYKFRNHTIKKKASDARLENTKECGLRENFTRLRRFFIVVGY